MHALEANHSCITSGYVAVTLEETCSFNGLLLFMF